MEPLEYFARFPDHGTFIRIDSALDFLAKEHVFIDLQIRNQVEFLVDHADTLVLGALRRQSPDLFAVQTVTAVVHRLRARDDFAQRGFPSAVFSKQRVHLALSQFKIHMIQSGDARIILADFLHFQNNIVIHSFHITPFGSLCIRPCRIWKSGRAFLADSLFVHCQILVDVVAGNGGNGNHVALRNAFAVAQGNSVLNHQFAGADRVEVNGAAIDGAFLDELQSLLRAVVVELVGVNALRNAGFVSTQRAGVVDAEDCDDLRMRGQDILGCGHAHIGGVAIDQSSRLSVRT